MRLFARISAFILVAAVALIELGCFALNVWANGRYEADGPWAVGQYAEPLRSTLVIVCVLGMAFAVFRAFFGKGKRLLRAAAAGITICLSAALSVEAGMGVLYHPITSEFIIMAFPWERLKLTFPHAGDGVCLEARTDGFYTWYLNGIAVHPRLLPLPLEAKELKNALSKPMPTECR